MIDSLAPPNELYGGGHCPVHPGGAAGIQFGREGPGGYIVMSKVQSAMKHERRKEDVGFGKLLLGIDRCLVYKYRQGISKATDGR